MWCTSNSPGSFPENNTVKRPRRSLTLVRRVNIVLLLVYFCLFVYRTHRTVVASCNVVKRFCGAARWGYLTLPFVVHFGPHPYGFDPYPPLSWKTQGVPLGRSCSGVQHGRHERHESHVAIGQAGGRRYDSILEPHQGADRADGGNDAGACGVRGRIAWL